MRLVYDALCTLADAVGRAMADPVHVTVFMPPLVARWNALPDTDRELLPLLECFTSIAIALGGSRFSSALVQKYSQDPTHFLCIYLVSAEKDVVPFSFCACAVESIYVFWAQLR